MIIPFKPPTIQTNLCIVPNLLMTGKFGDCELISMTRDVALAEDVCVATFYRAVIRTPKGKYTGAGETPSAAVIVAVRRMDGDKIIRAGQG